MRISVVRAKAFGPLLNQELGFQRGMNIVFGPNEAGKSSWHAAIFAGLGGMRRGRGAARKEDRDFSRKHRPWHGDDWAVEVDLELNDGRKIQVVQDLASQASCRVIDLDTGRDISGDFMNDGAPDAALLLGLTRDILPETICIRQAEVLRIRENSDELQEQLQRAATMGGTDETAEAAIDRISAYHSEHVGLRRRNSTRPLQVALNKVQEMREAVSTARSAHDVYLELVDRRNAAEVVAHEAAQRLRAAQRQLKLRDLADLNDRLERARKLAARFPNGEPAEPAVSLKKFSDMQEALTRFKNRPKMPPPLEGPTLEDLTAEIRDLPDAPTGDTHPAKEVLAAEEQWRKTRREIEVLRGAKPDAIEPPETGTMSASELRSAADQLDAPSPEVDRDLQLEVEALLAKSNGTFSDRSKIWPLIGGIAATVTGALLAALASGILYVVGFVILGVGVVSLLAGVILMRLGHEDTSMSQRHALQARLILQQEAATQAAKARQRLESRISEAGLPTAAERLRELAQMLDSADVVNREHRLWQNRMQSALQPEESAAEKLGAVLHTRTTSLERETHADVEGLLRHYRQQCEHRLEKAQKAARRASLERELRARRAAEQATQRDLAQIRDADRNLQAIAASVGIVDEDPQQAYQHLCEFKIRAEREIARWQQDRESWIALQEILKGETLAEIEAKQEVCERGLGPSENDVDVSLTEHLQDSVDDVEKRLEDAQKELNHLAGQVANCESSLPDVVAAEEALQQAECELQRAEGLDETLTLTRQFLEEARDRIQRDIAPCLKATVQAHLPALTSDRYHEVLVDPANLEVKVRPIGGDWRSASLLSHGTAEQIYLLLRLAVAEHLVTTGEPAPLLMDDVTVQSDADRSVAFLDLMHEISRDRQIILFSQEQEVHDWAATNLRPPDDKLIELEVLPSCVETQADLREALDQAEGD